MRNSIRLTRLPILVAGALAATFLGVGAAGAGGGCHEDPTEESTNQVELTALCFRPTVVRVDPGSTVEFVNRDQMAHNVVGHAMSWGQVDNLASRDRMTADFDEPGIYPFSCTIHPGMVGAVVVGSVAPVAASPAAASATGTMWTTLGVTGVAALFLAGVWQWSKPAAGDPESSPGS